MASPDVKPANASTEELPISWYSWVVAVLCLLSYAVSFVSRNVWSTALPVAAPSLGLSMTAAGGLMTAFYIGYVVSNFVTGPFIDKFGPRKVLAAASLVTGLFTLLIPLFPNYAMIFLLRIGAGIGSGPLFAGGVKFQLAWFPKKARATAMGLVMTGPSVGGAFASGILAPVIRTAGWQTAFTYGGIICLVVAVLTFLFAKERGAALVTKKPAASTSDAPAPKKQGLSAAKDVILNRSFLIGTIACFLSIGAGQGFTTWILVYLSQGRGFDLVAAGSIVAASQVVQMAGPTLSGIVSDFLKRRKPVCYIGSVGIAAVMISLAVFSDTGILWGVMLFRGLIGSFMGNNLNTLQAESAAGPHAGTAMGFYNGVAQLGSVIFPLGLGIVLDLTGNNYFIVWMTIAATYLLCGILISFMTEKKAEVAQPKSVTA
ncbi:hexuronate transporter [Oxobacter pfennigii]|uniref:Hexuronate transporter n=1 Tax=Oxobacter pfennigii TaxID=36849 RepID=A0A0P8WSQ5_9CLOT|nr:MFS transporter [Oxobacter pfennigii]KPU45639.1 hexuronate transporter [Oxobacter pfennigii]